MQLELMPDTTALLVIDWQERLCAAMPAEVTATATRNATHLLTLSARQGLPVLATEQYPQGLGPTLAPVRELLPCAALPKTSFSAMRDSAAASALREAGRSAVVVVGMETHVCVYQTVRDLVHAGYSVHVPADAVLSRTKENWRRGLALVERAGAVVTTTEAVLFDLLKVGQGEVFKEVSKRIR
ncbi:isochorismatase family protein [Myxococcota bacterium]|nr:isochorismatase family protein [Myxococcota bacterium]